jgi:signal transduction histidine kinase
MIKKLKRNSYFRNGVVAVVLLIGVVLFAVVFLVSTRYEQSEGNRVIEETLDFMKMQCLRFDNLNASEQAEDQIQLLDKTKELERCLEDEEPEDKEKFLKDYAENQRLSGILLLDREGKLTESVTLDEETYEDWEGVLLDKNVINVVEYSKKSYLSNKQEEDGTIYDYAAIGMCSGEGMVFCYTKRMQDDTDEMSVGLANMLSGYQLEMDGLILITDGSRILSSNDETLLEKEVDDFSLLASHEDEIPSEKVSMLKEDGTKYLTRYGKFRTYYLYVFFPAKEVFRQRSALLAYVMILYVLFLLAIAIIRQREMQSANVLKMKFLRQMSHDIRTPINGIRGMIRIGNSFPDDMEKQQECRDKIWEASGFLIDLVNDVLDMGKLESGEIKLEEKPFRLQELVDNELTVLEEQARERSVMLQIGRMEGEHWNLIGSPVHVQRVLTNVIANAIKYNRENGTVTISCRELAGKSTQESTRYEFICEDTGIGMSQEFQKHMFEQFSQENVSGEVSHHGTGLGLAIVKSLVQVMKGDIWCESERDKGTTFHIILPFGIDAEEKIPEIVTGEGSEAQLQGVSVLLVEDNEMNMEIAQFLLEEEGATIRSAWNGQEALEIFAASEMGEFDVILMDVMMPVMDGEAAARAIRALDRADAKTIPIIATTANAFEDDIESALQAGMNAHIAKPINLLHLKQVIRKYLNRV